MMSPSLRALSAAAFLVLPTIAMAQEPFRIAVIDDLSGMFSGNGGPGTVLATTMAVEDFGGSVLGRKIEVLAADHQSKPDVGSALAGRYIDEQKVVAIVNGGASSVGLAVQTLAAQRKITTLISGGYAPNFSGERCSPYGTQWAPSTGELAGAIAKGIVDEGGKSWYFITADYVFGHALYADASKAVVAAGGRVAGETKHPLNTADMASPLLAAQASGAQVIGLANAGPDLVNTIKQAREFGIGSKTATMLVFENNVTALGLDLAQGMRLPAPFYWDFNDESRAFAKKIMARNGNVVPTMGHAQAYMATTHYLKAVAAAGSADAAAVARQMHTLPIQTAMFQNAKMLANGRVVMDMHVFEVKSPKDSKSPADLYRKVGASIPGDALFTPAERSGCPHLVGK